MFRVPCYLTGYGKVSGLPSILFLADIAVLHLVSGKGNLFQ